MRVPAFAHPRLLRNPGLSFAVTVSLLLLFPLAASTIHAQQHSVTSPDGRTRVVIENVRGRSGRLTWGVFRDGRALVLPSAIALHLDSGQGDLGVDARIEDVSSRSVNRILEPVVPEKTARVTDRFEELRIDFEGDWSLEVRAYDDGVAYRLVLRRDGRLRVTDEAFNIRFPGRPRVLFAEEERFLTHQERHYVRTRLDSIEAGRFASPPALVLVEDGTRVLVTEADLRSYPGLYLAGTGEAALRGLFPPYPLEERQVRDRTVRVTRTAPYLADIEGDRTLPWRVLVIADEDAGLLASTLVWRLAPELQIEDPFWIRPGKVAWDWWNALNLQGVPFRTGVNTETYRYYIDFAADHGIEYVILDEGWYRLGDLFDINPEVDLQALLDYGKERGVGLILWVVWKTLDDQFEEAMAWFEELGVVGIKVDFMQRDDQPVVEYYWKVASEAARRHLLVDFHGAYKPTGLRRAYPNVLTREGVLGLEHTKWTPYPDPEHNVTLPFTRMVAGPMDYTPGAMRNAQERQFLPVYDRPMSLGTRCHQLAMYVVYESPLQMLCDAPTAYEREPVCLEFLASVPTTWSRTVPLAGEVGEYLAVARMGADGTWYVAAMTDWTPRELNLDLGFLGPGPVTLEILEDGPNADRHAEDFAHRIVVHDTSGPLSIRLAPGGGWAARIPPRPDVP